MTCGVTPIIAVTRSGCQNLLPPIPIRMANDWIVPKGGSCAGENNPTLILENTVQVDYHRQKHLSRALCQAKILWVTACLQAATMSRRQRQAAAEHHHRARAAVPRMQTRSEPPNPTRKCPFCPCTTSRPPATRRPSAQPSSSEVPLTREI